MTIPPAPITGSQKNAATRSAPSWLISFERLWIVPGDVLDRGTSGPNAAALAGMPASVVP